MNTTCPTCSGILQEKLTKAGVLVDVCNTCHGHWLDHGELNFFCKSRKLLFEYEKIGLRSKKLTNKLCPKCIESKLLRGKLPIFGQMVDECPKCEGLFFEKEELVKLNSSKYVKGLLQASFLKSNSQIIKMNRLLSLGVTSLIVLSLMYGVLVGLIIFLIELGFLQSSKGILVLIGFVGIQFTLGPMLFDWSLRLFGSLEWVNVDELPKQFSIDLKNLCRENKLKIPKIGIIEDGSPQAYTYGRTTRDARVVFSRGMFDLLQEEELKAVLAHELGHIKHWDFLVMSMAQLVPLIFYQIYRILRGSRSSNRGNKKGNSQILLAAFVAYALYLVTEYLVLFISRLREYHADRFSCRVTKNPNALITALTKIGLGLAVNANENKEEKSKTDLERRRAVQAIGIMNITGSKSLLLSNGEGQIEEFGSENLKEIMKWDLWNPWAGFYELQSTHPLISKRMNFLAYEALKLGQEPYVVFDQKRTDSSWDEFFKDLFILSLPFLLGLLSTFLFYKRIDDFYLGHFLHFALGYGLGGMIRLQFIYPSGIFIRTSVASLLRKISVSPVSSFPVKLKGKIIGRGESGFVFSEDMVLKDKTGLIFLDHEPFGFNLFFALKTFHEFEGEEVEVHGWYRRSPVPYVEIKKITSRDFNSSSYTKSYKEVLYLILVVVGAYFSLKMRII
jgi:Zn-dependent protease with chaperone function